MEPPLRITPDARFTLQAVRGDIPSFLLAWDPGLAPGLHWTPGYGSSPLACGKFHRPA